MNIVSSNWNNESAFLLEPACNDSYTINDLAYDVQTGECALFEIYENKEHLASMVLRLEENAGKKELVVVALGGSAPSGSLIEDISDFWDNLAKDNGARTVRAHVAKAGMARLMERVGGVLSEYVYRREVS